MTSFVRTIPKMPFADGFISLAMPLALFQKASGAKATPSGEAKSANTKSLEAGAKILQGTAPLKPFNVYLDGFRAMKVHPEMQMEAHHYCHQVNEDLARCILFDGNTVNR